MLATIPLMIVPLVLYNIAALDVLGGSVFLLRKEVLSISMLSGATWTMSVGDAVLIAGFIVLGIEVLKFMRERRTPILGHILSVMVFAIFVVEFLLVRGAATPTFFLLTIIAFIAIAIGVATSIRITDRDVSIGL